MDLLWPTLLLAGAERVRIAAGASGVTPLEFESYPYSHSLLTTVTWGALIGAFYAWRKSARGAVVVGVCVVSHWFLDLLVHYPDLPVAPGTGAKLGFGLWDSLPATLAVEFLLFGAGVWLYARHTVARGRAGRIGLWLLTGFLAAIYLGNLFGPPPPDVTALAWGAQAQWLLVAFGYWLDSHRATRP